MNDYYFSICVSWWDVEKKTHVCAVCIWSFLQNENNKGKDIKWRQYLFGSTHKDKPYQANTAFHHIDKCHDEDEKEDWLHALRNGGCGKVLNYKACKENGSRWLGQEAKEGCHHIGSCIFEKAAFTTYIAVYTMGER